ncbi:hypothetical protein [Acidovorax sp. MR-S7]|uniref:hypothetical protein n=1 Tax=Acidovorax sp. MR-S7 TaxID=1268622 RepID=UPI0003703710|nr:hypothetical protein [Acidovorax sp. MR-S7]GAD24493.1 metallo-beta-lactamase [Acidovorax sp. MR-S7]
MHDTLHAIHCADSGFFDEATNTVTYLLSDAATRQAVVVGPVPDYDHRSGKVSTASADHVLVEAAAQALQKAWILETHAHLDHLSAAPYAGRWPKAESNGVRYLKI